MKVYAIKASGNYSGGMAIIVADSEDDAKALAEKNKSSTFGIWYETPDEVELLPLECEGPARVLVDYEMGE